MHGQEGVAAALLAPGTRPALPQPGVCVGWGGCSACQRGGRPVCFGGLAAVGWLLGNLSAAVWACLGSGSHRQSETRLCSTPEPAGRDPGTQAGLGVVGRAGWGHRVSPGPSWVRLRGVSGEGCVCVCVAGRKWLRGSWEGALLGQCPQAGTYGLCPSPHPEASWGTGVLGKVGGHGLRFSHFPWTPVLPRPFSLFHPVARLLLAHPNPGPPPVRGVQKGLAGSPGSPRGGAGQKTGPVGL